MRMVLSFAWGLLSLTLQILFVIFCMIMFFVSLTGGGGD